jgi:D-3-phosphoglycerate dehydrogenase
MGMRVLVSDPFAKPGSMPTAVEMCDLDEIVRESHVVSLHCPLTPDTRHILNADRLAKLKDQTIIINTARAGLFEEATLLEQLHQRRLHAGIDCFEDEPLGSNSPWLSAPNCVLTPHIGGTTSRAFRQMGVMAAESLLAHLDAAS